MTHKTEATVVNLRLDRRQMKHEIALAFRQFCIEMGKRDIGVDVLATDRLKIISDNLWETTRDDVTDQDYEDMTARYAVTALRRRADQLGRLGAVGREQQCRRHAEQIEAEVLDG